MVKQMLFRNQLPEEAMTIFDATPVIAYRSILLKVSFSLFLLLLRISTRYISRSNETNAIETNKILISDSLSYQGAAL